MTKPYLSIVIPTRNRPHILAQSLICLENQENAHVDFEVIIIDDHSLPVLVDEYKKILFGCSKFTISYIPLPDNQRGTVYARNLGLKNASGEIIGFLDDDSFPSKNWVATIFAFFTNSPEIHAITGRIEAYELDHPLSAFRQYFYNARYRTITTSDSVKSICKRFNIMPHEKYFLADNLSGGNSAVRISAMNEVGHFDTRFQMMHDKELSLRLLLNKKNCIYASDLVVKHVHTKSFSDALGKSFFSGKASYRLYKKHKSVLKNTVLNPIKPVRNLVDAAPLLRSLKIKGVLLVFFIFVLEYVHQAGYLNEWVANATRSWLSNTPLGG